HVLAGVALAAPIGAGRSGTVESTAGTLRRCSHAVPPASAAAASTRAIRKRELSVSSTREKRTDGSSERRRKRDIGRNLDRPGGPSMRRRIATLRHRAYPFPASGTVASFH